MFAHPQLITTENRWKSDKVFSKYENMAREKNIFKSFVHAEKWVSRKARRGGGGGGGGGAGGEGGVGEANSWMLFAGRRDLFFLAQVRQIRLKYPW